MLSPPARQFLGLMVVALGCYPALSYAEVRCGQSLPRRRRWACGCAGETASPLRRDWLPRYRGDTDFPVLHLHDRYRLRNVGLVDRITELYSAATNSAAQVVVIGISSALGSALLNNHPMAILNALAIRNLPDGTQDLVLAALIGGDLGPRLLPLGSLAGLLWLDQLRREGTKISVAHFILVGLPVTIPTLALSLFILVLGMGDF